MEVLVLLFACMSCAFAYNLEGRLPLYKRGVEGSTFGFSVAMHKTSNMPQRNFDKSLLVIGSPTATALSSQGNTKNPGGIFYCPVTTNSEDCSRVEMDSGGSTEENNKTDQWLGVSLKSQGDGKFLITCAHRFAQRTLSSRRETERLCGKCFLLNGTDANSLYEITPEETGNKFIASPCDKKSEVVVLNNKNALAYSQAGVSVSWIGDEYVLGAPGAWAWSGGMFDFELVDLESNNPLDWMTSSEMYETQGCRVRGRDVERAVKCQDIPLRRDSYMGFSIDTSNSMSIEGTDETIYIAGAPRGNFTGAVVLYRKATDGSLYLTPIVEDIIMGEHMGSSFGFSVAATDLNGDGLDDLLVGSPQYYQYTNEGKYGGAVYVYLNDRSKRFSEIEPKVFHGPLDSFFGYSIEPLGDIDQDGFNDFAVGAPYQSPSGKVYIYRGSGDGIIRKSQTLEGDRYTSVSPEMKAFGVSLSSRVDIDNNKYPDLLVGTLKDQAILFRSRPIITVESSLETSTTGIDLKTPNCPLEGKMYSCFDVRYCFTYQSRHKEYTDALPIRYTVVLDSSKQNERKSSRVRFTSPRVETSREQVTNIPGAGVKHCPDGFSRVYFSENAKDRLHSIDIDFEFSLVSDGNDISPEAPDDPVFRMIGDPILDADFPKERRATVSLVNDCGDDGCQSNLRVDGSTPPEIYVGGDDKFILTLNVSNDGEEAHEASVAVKLPSRVFYDNYTVTRSSGADISCFTSEKASSTFITCLLGNPYVTGSRDTIEIDLDVSALTPDTKQVTFDVTSSTTSSNPEAPHLKLVSDVIIQMELSLSGYGQPQQVRYTYAPIRGESAFGYTNEIGPLINHTFIIKNDGQQTAGGILLNIDFPQEINNGKWLLYLVSTRVFAGARRVVGECSQDDVNPLGYKLPVTSALASRSKRQTSSGLYQPKRLATVHSAGVYRSTVTLNCHQKTSRCITLVCSVEPILPGATVSVFLQSRLWNATFLEEFKEVDLVDVGVYAELSNTESNVKITGEYTSQEVATTVDHAFIKEDITSVFPWWYILIGIIIALLVYSIIIFCLIKCGFFKRKRHHAHARDNDENTNLVEEKHESDEERV